MKSYLDRKKRTPTQPLAGNESFARARPLWLQRFLGALANPKTLGNIGVACQAANCSRKTAYKRRDEDEDFRAAWDDIIEGITDTIEGKAVELATIGHEKPVFVRGEVVGNEYVVDSGMAQFLLRSRRRSVYGEKIDIQHSGTVQHQHAHVALIQNLASDKGAEIAERMRRLLGNGPVETQE